jgi:hypothetical protein
MQTALFPTTSEFQAISYSKIRERGFAERTIGELEKKGQTVGLSLKEVEIFLRALAVLREYPSWAQ